MPDAVQSMRLERQLAWVLMAAALMLVAVVHGLGALPELFALPMAPIAQDEAAPSSPPQHQAMPEGIAVAPRVSSGND